jgi:hypothetical protein
VIKALVVIALSGATAAAAGQVRVPPIVIAKFPAPKSTKGTAVPPVRLLPPKALEPARDVRASTWRSPYCTHWTDGVEDCSRASIHQAAVCKPRSESERAGKRAPIACLNADFDRLARICFRFMISVPPEPNSRGQIDQSTWSQSNWVSAKTGGWRFEPFVDDATTSLSTALAGPGRSPPIPNSRTLYCLEPYRVSNEKRATNATAYTKD